MAEREREEGKTLEMRIAELENKLAGVTAPGAVPQLSTIPQLCSFCSYCYYCSSCVVERTVARAIAAQQAQLSAGPVSPFAGGFGGLGY
jgi:hypothetical protein